MPPSEESLALLRSIDATLKQLLALSMRRTHSTTEGGASVASDADLDGAHGDPTVKAKDPRDWNGPVMKGRRFSECPAEYLDLLAARYDFFASKDGADAKDVKYARLDAARARGWARRVREGKGSPAPQAETGTADGWASSGAWGQSK